MVSDQNRNGEDSLAVIIEPAYPLAVISPATPSAFQPLALKKAGFAR